MRAKPHVVVVDDWMLFRHIFEADSLTTFGFVESERFAKYGPQKAIWPMIIEKAAAKVKGNYCSLVAGYVSNSLKTLTGAPTGNYYIEMVGNSGMWDIIYASKNTNNFLVNLGTSGASDSVINVCGVTQMHAYSVLSAFTL